MFTNLIFFWFTDINWPQQYLVERNTWAHFWNRFWLTSFSQKKYILEVQMKCQNKDPNSMYIAQKQIRIFIYIRKPGKITPIIWCTANCSSICAFGVNKLKFYAVPRHFELWNFGVRKTNEQSYAKARQKHRNSWRNIGVNAIFLDPEVLCCVYSSYIRFTQTRPGVGNVALL